MPLADVFIRSSFERTMSNKWNLTNLSDGSTEFEQNLRIVKYSTFLVISLVSIAVFLFVFIPLSKHCRISKEVVIFRGFLFSCLVNDIATCYNCIYGLKLSIRGTWLLSRRYCILFGFHNFLYVFSQTSVTILLLIGAVGRYLAVTKPVVYRGLRMAHYVVVLVVVYVLRDDFISAFCLQFQVFPPLVHEIHIYMLMTINTVSIAVYTLLIKKIVRLSNNAFTNQQTSRQLLITKRLSTALIDIVVLMVIPQFSHMALIIKQTLRQFLAFLWIPYHVSVLITMLMFCYYQPDVRHAVVSFWTCKRYSVVQTFAIASLGHLHGRSSSAQ
ncbi:unnamed protein product [Soboliphyme baturini]|uniref:G_PROTEIN_RECEP_F1_2 domain-containing protein n=1 Tax=Soboliphyme baturini TaxID=241478 RepID=A0A183IKX3_9BILA|nr:unnamed protein product [Soboliphyme baturini]